MEKRKTICPLDCPDACGIVATLQEGKIVKVEGDPEHPNTQGFLCKKVRTYHHRVQSPDRVLFPQRRIGEKGEGKFERISWEEAWQILVHQLTTIKQQYGSEAVLPYSYAGNMGLVNLNAGGAFFHKYGASRLMQTICTAAARAGWFAHYGNNPGSPPEKALAADLIVAWGINVKVTNIHFMPFVVKARQRGAKFVVIDPYLNSTAKNADFYFPIKPGGDTALALGLMKLLQEKNALDGAFIHQYTEGFDELATYLAQHPLEEFLEPCGFSPAQIETLANLLMQHPKTFFRVGIGLTRNTQGAMSSRAIVCLAAALGLFDGSEGKGALQISNSFRGDTNRLNYRSLLEAPTRQVNMVQLGDALTQLEPPIRCVFVYSSNPMSIAPDSSKVRAGFAREDLFTIVHEQFLTPTARYADLLLPATTSFENHDVYTGYGHFYMSKTAPVIPPKGEAVSNFELFQTLANKMGYDEAPFQQTAQERIEDFLASMEGISAERKQEGILAGDIVCSDWIEHGGNFKQFPQPFQFALSKENLPPIDSQAPRIPSLLPRKEFDDPALQAKYPLQMITPPMTDMLNSTFGERYEGQIGSVLIHPHDAQSRQIMSGDWVEIFNGRGKNIRKAMVSEKTQRGLLIVEGIYWESADSGKTGVNDLTSQAATDMGGGSTFHESRVQAQRMQG